MFHFSPSWYWNRKRRWTASMIEVNKKSNVRTIAISSNNLFKKKRQRLTWCANRVCGKLQCNMSDDKNNLKDIESTVQ